MTSLSAPIENLYQLSTSDRIRVIRELVLLCYAEGQLDQPLQVTSENDPFVGLVVAMFPAGGEPPELSQAQRAEIRRRMEDPTRLSHAEVIAAIRSA